MPPRISFCTTCRDRTYQLRRVFDRNIDSLLAHPQIEWVLLNYASRDDLHEFVMSRLAALPSRFVYAWLASDRPWHLSVAKNSVHRLGCGSILANLDCDNCIGDAVALITEKLISEAVVLHMWTGEAHDGSCGRIALHASTFHTLGGYDEGMRPMGYQDKDLLARAAAANFQVVSATAARGQTVRNGKAESVRACGDGREATWEKYNTYNRKRSQANIDARIYTANNGLQRSALGLRLATGGAEPVKR